MKEAEDVAEGCSQAAHHEGGSRAISVLTTGVNGDRAPFEAFSSSVEFGDRPCLQGGKMQQREEIVAEVLGLNLS